MAHPPAELRPSAPARFIHLLALSSFAIAQPLLDLLGRNATFFVAHAVQGGELIAILLGIFVLPGLGLWLLGLFTSLLHRGLGWSLHLGCVFLLFIVGALAPLVRAAPESTLGIAVGAALFAAAATWLYDRAAPLRSFIGVLAIAPIAFGTVFLSQPDVQMLLRSTAIRSSAAQSGAVERGPVVVVVLDELPLSSLLDAKGKIDRIRYPVFAKLADHSTWVRSTSAVSPYTAVAVPAILTGRYPVPSYRLPIAPSYPDNLFTLLESTHRLHVVETRTLLYPQALQAAGADRRGRCLFSDLAIVYGHLLLPQGPRQSLPAVDQDWTCFASPRVEEVTEVDLEARLEEMKAAAADTAGAGPLLQFIDSVAEEQSAAAPGRGSLHFIHATFPHTPWRYTPSGRVYAPDSLFGIVNEVWSSDDWWPREAQQRHLLQVQFADRVIGQLIEAMEEAGIYDESMLVVTADHGVGFWPGESRRNVPTASHPEDILSVPLFIKRPHQNEPLRIERLAETIDILPTIAGVIGAEVSWPVDGCSVFDASCPVRRQRRVVTKREKGSANVFHYPPRIVRKRTSLNRRIAFFGAGDPSRLYRFGPYAALGGRRVSELPMGEEGVGSFTREAGPAGVVVNVRVVGRLDLVRPVADTPFVAIAVNGTIETIVPAPKTRWHGYRVAAMLPEERFASDGEVVAVYLVEGEPENSRLFQLTMK